MAKKKPTATLTGEAAKEGVGLHRKPNAVEIVISQTGLAFMRANVVVKGMTDDEKTQVETRDPAKVKAAVDAAQKRHLEKHKATEKNE